MQHVLLKSFLAVSLWIQPLAQLPAQADQIASSLPQGESGANSLAFPTQILRTGVDLTSSSVSPNTIQLCNNIGLTPVLEQIQTLKARVSAPTSVETIAARQDLWEAIQKAELIIQRTNLEVDFATAEIEAETQLYQEILSTFASDRDKLLAKINAASFISNGILWAACEGVSIATINTVFAKNPRTVPQFAIPSGILGIAAGVVPSVASMYTLKAVNGKQKTSEVEPNMLAKLFDYPTNPNIEYPASVWTYLHQVPADQPRSKIRKEQLVDRWITDSNMSVFTDRKSKTQLDILTASVPQKKGLSIASLSSRIAMLSQLHSEIWKIKRLLLEATMVLQGDKQIGQ
jgi:hypothetical protein